jgi:hypothetical protein
MKRAILSTATILLFLLTLTSTAQNYSLRNRWTIRLGYSPYKEDYMNYKPQNFRAEVNYGLLEYLEIGAYIGYNRCQTSEQAAVSDPIGKYYSILDAPVPSYGLSTSLHVLPFFLKKKDFWMDLYFKGEFGGYTILSKDGYSHYPGQKNGIDYGVYGGLAVYPLKHIGLFAEYGYGNKSNMRFGLSYKFGS